MIFVGDSFGKILVNFGGPSDDVVFFFEFFLFLGNIEGFLMLFVVFWAGILEILADFGANV